VVIIGKPAECEQTGRVHSVIQTFQGWVLQGIVKEVGRSYFYNDDGNIKFPFSWTDNPWRYKDMKMERLSVTNREGK